LPFPLSAQSVLIILWKSHPSKNQKSKTPDIPKQIEGATILRQARARSVSK
jgi:hypothetical protein